VTDIEKSAAAIPGLHLAGSSYRGVGMPDCIHSAHQVVKHILG
jgi:oxygen-dependent protoporphyrinogen oxidase